MGSCTGKEISFGFSEQKHSKNMLNKYIFLSTIGNGGYSIVKLALNLQNKKKYAIKILDKGDMIDKKWIKNCFDELQILKYVNNNFNVNAIEAFQDDKNLYIVMNYMCYGNLRTFLRKHKHLNKNEIRFITICICLGLQYLHKKKIIHGDLKPQNIMIDSDGYFRIGDYSTSTQNCNKSNYTKYSEKYGTSGYIAPQVLNQDENCYTYAIDYYAVGRIVNDMLNHNSNYTSIPEQDTNTSEYEQLCQQFANQLTQQDPEKRLGYSGWKEIWSHPWLNCSKSLLKQFYQKKTSLHPFLPTKINFIQINPNKIRKSFQTENQTLKSLLLSEQKVQSIFQTIIDLFNGYFFVNSKKIK